MLCRLVAAAGCVVCFSIVVLAQTEKQPAKASRPFVVLSNQSLTDLEKKIETSNKTEEVFGSTGVELRVAVQHEKGKGDALAEVHDASDDVYYVLEGSARLTIGGSLDAPREAEPGEWRSQRISGGQELEIHKGDLIIVPRGTPHVRSTEGKDFTMLLIKVYTGGRPAPAKKS